MRIASVPAFAEPQAIDAPLSAQAIATNETTEFTGSVGSGLVLRVTDQNGASGLVGLRADLGFVAKSVTTYADGRKEIRWTRDIRIIRGEIQTALNSVDIREVHVQFAYLETNADFGIVDRISLTPVEIRVRPGADVPVTLEIDVLKTGLRKDIVGSALKERALSAGINLGYFSLSGSSPGPNPDGWSGTSIFSAAISGIYAFTPSAKIQGAVELMPLRVSDSNRTNQFGLVVNSTVEFDWNITQYITIFLRNQFQLTAIPRPSDPTQIPARAVNMVTGGAQVNW